MKTRVLGYEHAETIAEIETWANDLLEKDVPGSPGYIVVSIVQFQIIPGQNGYDAMFLVEVIEHFPEEQIALKEADIVVIEQMTSSLEETA
ncbi:MAG: hypothetical protein M3Z08_08880 [Chloroflexota bacterium]|nr:hypothetical protein [Chloroflexota bacterium]